MFIRRYTKIFNLSGQVMGHSGYVMAVTCDHTYFMWSTLSSSSKKGVDHCTTSNWLHRICAELNSCVLWDASGKSWGHTTTRITHPSYSLFSFSLWTWLQAGCIYLMAAAHSMLLPLCEGLLIHMCNSSLFTWQSHFLVIKYFQIHMTNFSYC